MWIVTKIWRMGIGRQCSDDMTVWMDYIRYGYVNIIARICLNMGRAYVECDKNLAVEHWETIW